MYKLRLLKTVSLVTLCFFVWFAITADFTFAAFHPEEPQKKDKGDETVTTQVQDDIKSQEKKIVVERTNVIHKEGKKKKSRLLKWIIGGVIVLAIVLILIPPPPPPPDGTNDYDIETLGIEWMDIPEGDFEMGDHFGDGDEVGDEIPVHTVFLDGYKISKYEVTFEQYEYFCRADGRTIPPDEGWGRGQRPVIHVTWEDAKGFCDWLSERTGKKIALPTEAQWEKAARGTDKLKYPWGNTLPNCNLANYGTCEGKTMVVGSYPDGKSPYGVNDMAGNVWEWCKDLYDSDYYSKSPKDNPESYSGGSRVIRGGGFSSKAGDIRCTERDSLSSANEKRYIGFRICRNH